MRVELGAGTIVVALVDREGRTRAEREVTISGSPDVRGYTEVPLRLQTTEGEVEVAPVLVSRSDPEQAVLFDDEDPAAVTRRRGRQIDCGASTLRRLAEGRVERLERGIQFGPPPAGVLD